MIFFKNQKNESDLKYDKRIQSHLFVQDRHTLYVMVSGLFEETKHSDMRGTAVGFLTFVSVSLLCRGGSGRH